MSIQNNLKAKNFHDKDSIEYLIKKGSSLLTAGDYIESNKWFHRGYSLSKVNGDQKKEQELRILWYLGNNFFIMGQYDSASYYFSSIVNLEKPKTHINDSLVAFALAEKGSVYMKMSQFDSARKYYDLAKVRYKQVFGARSLLLANIMDMKGGLAFRMFDTSLALKFFKKSLAIRKEHLDEYTYSMSKSYFNIGIAYGRNKDNLNARIYFKKALKIRKRILSKNHQSLGMLYTSIGISYLMENDKEAAILYFKQAKLIYESLKYEHKRLYNVYKNIGNIYRNNGTYDSAKHYYSKSEESTKRIYGHKSTKLGMVLNSLAETSEAQSDDHQAAIYYHKAIMATILDDVDSSIYAKLSLSKAILGGEIAWAILGKAQSLHRLYNKNQNENDLIGSYQTYRLIVELLREFIENGTSDNTMLYLLDSTSVYNQRMISLSSELYARTGNEKYIYDTYKTINNSRSMLLNFNNKETAAKKFIQIPDSIKKIEVELRKSLVQRKTQLLFENRKGKKDSIKVSEMEIEIFDLKQSHKSITQYLEVNHPSYLQMKYRNVEIEVDELQNQLGKDRQLIEYVYGDSLIYAYIISSNSFDVVKVGPINHIDTLIESYHQSIINNDFSNFSRHSNLLYKKLFEPISDKISKDRIIIIPDGPIWRINFDLLLTNDAEGSEYNQLPYLINKYTISYNYSSQAIINESKIKVQRDSQELLAFSFGESDEPTIGSSLSLSVLRAGNVELPGSRKEIGAISSLFDGNYFYGNRANESNFKAIAQDYSILHLALHGQINYNNPDNSYLSFYSKGDSIEDGKLYAFELYSMDLNSELAVLSACNTGTGKVSKGEGVLSLGRAFLFSGVKSLLLTNWQVSDETTPQIMEDFYFELKQGKRKSEALRIAKLNYINKSDNLSSAPFYWGSFYLIGSDNVMVFANSNTWLYLSLGVGLLLLLIFTAYFVRKNITLS